MTERFDFTQKFVIITKLGTPASGLQAFHAPLRTKKTDSNMGLLSFHLCAQSLCCSLPRRVVHQVRLSPAAWTKHRNALLGRCKMQPFDGNDGITSWCTVPVARFSSRYIALLRSELLRGFVSKTPSPQCGLREAELLGSSLLSGLAHCCVAYSVGGFCRGGRPANRALTSDSF